MRQRYYSLDVFRGATVAFMILVNNPGSWQYIFSPLKHAPWHGATPTDLVFPFFLFAIGNAMAFVMPKLRQGSDAVFWKKIAKRSLFIFLIGLLLNWWPFVFWQGDTLVLRSWVNPDDNEQGVRILGVLQRIAICYFFAAILVFYLKTKPLLITSFAILLSYWIICIFFASDDPYSMANWFGTALDNRVLGTAHMYKGEGVPFDPEGIASTLPAIVQVVFGYFAGLFIRQGSIREHSLVNVHYSIQGMLSTLMVIAFLFTLAGSFWGLSFPINKKIWTSSYVLYTTGLALSMIGVLIWLIEVKQVKNTITHFFDVFGKNPLFIFVISALIPKTLALIRIPMGADENGQPRFSSPLQWFYSELCAKVPGPPELGSLIYALTLIVALWLICYVLDRKGIYIKV